MELSQLIKDTAEDSGAANFYNGYSGRGMYGRKCVGLTGSMQDIMQVIGAVIKEAHFNSDEIEFTDVVDCLLDFKQDSMGLDVIVYWPELEPVTESENENDGQPDEAQEWHDFDPEC